MRIIGGMIVSKTYEQERDDHLNSLIKHLPKDADKYTPRRVGEIISDWCKSRFEKILHNQNMRARKMALQDSLVFGTSILVAHEDESVDHIPIEKSVFIPKEEIEKPLLEKLASRDAILSKILSHIQCFEHTEKRYQEAYGEDAKYAFAKMAEIRAIRKELAEWEKNKNG